MIREMTASLEKLASDIQAVDSSYTSAKARDYLSFSEDGVGFADRINIARSFLGAALILLMAFLWVYLSQLRSGKKGKEV